MKKIITKISVLMIAFLPITIFARAQNTNYIPTSSQTNTLSDLVTLVIAYFNIGVYLIMGLAIVMFVWNIFKYYIKGGDKVDRVEAGKYVMWSIIGFFVILSFWGLVNILTNTLRLNSMPPSQYFGSFGSSYNYNVGSGPFSNGISNVGPSNGITNGTQSPGLLRSLWNFIW